MSNLNKPESQYNPLDWFIKCLKNYANFSGRARRKEYWFFVLIQFILLIIAGILDSVIFKKPFIFYTITALGLFIPAVAVGVRRMHDIGRTGWLLLLSCIPLIGLIVLYWLVSNTSPETNKWGQPAK